MSRDDAARYIGVGTSKFDEMIADQRMPRPKRVDGRVIWDRIKLDAAFSDLTTPASTRWIKCWECRSSNVRSTEDQEAARPEFSNCVPI
jgi:predicted DNA-binding transcriptional regulator AlpA